MQPMFKKIVTLIAATAVLPLVAVPPVWAQATPLGSEFRVNTQTAYGQENPSIAATSAGGFVIVWESGGAQDGDAYGIFGQRFDASGTAVGTEFAVNTYTTGGQIEAVVDSDANGKFVVVWQSAGQDSYGAGIFGQRYNADGSVLGSEFMVNTFTTGAQSGPEVSMGLDGSFVVMWNDDVTEGNGSGVFARRFDAAGAAVGAEFLLNTFTTGNQNDVAIGMAADGSFVAAWVSSSFDGSATGIAARRFDASGVAAAPELLVNTYTTGSQSRPSVGVRADGSFVVVWEGYVDAVARADIFGQAFDNTGATVGTEFLVNTFTTGNSAQSAVSSEGDGFIATWSSLGQDGSGDGVFARRFGVDGTPLSDEFLVNTFTAGVQRDAVAVETGSFVATWLSIGQDGDAGGVYAQRFAGLAVTTTTTLPPPGCGDPSGDGNVTAGDALLVLQAAVGAGVCLPCICDVNDVGGITSTDALLVLQAAVGQPVTLTCPPC